MNQKFISFLIKYSKILATVGTAIGIVYVFSTWINKKIDSKIETIARIEAARAIQEQLVKTALENQRRLTVNQYAIFSTLQRHMDRDNASARVNMERLQPPLMLPTILETPKNLVEVQR